MGLWLWVDNPLLLWRPHWKLGFSNHYCVVVMWQGAMEYHRELVSYFNKNGVSVIILLRRNALKRLVSTLANAYDKKEKLLNGTHKSHVHSKEEVCLFFHSKGCCCFDMRSLVIVSFFLRLFDYQFFRSRWFLKVKLTHPQCCLQANKLAEFKPIIDTKRLPINLQRVEEISRDVLRLFNGTRHMLLYYEDLVKDPEVQLAIYQFVLQFPLFNVAFFATCRLWNACEVILIIYWVIWLHPLAAGGAKNTRVSWSGHPGFGKRASEDSHAAFKGADWELGGGFEKVERNRVWEVSDRQGLCIVYLTCIGYETR